MNKFQISLLIAIMLWIAGCGHSQIMAETPPDTGESADRPSFSLAGDFPADIVIPDIDGMRSTAFIASTSTPAGVIAVNIDADSMQLSTAFKGLICPQGSGIPAKLIVSGLNEAFLLTSSSIISFDPKSGAVYHVVNALEPVNIGGGHVNSDGSNALVAITPAYPGGIAVIGNTLFVSSANYLRTQAPAKTAPGTVQAFKIYGDHTLRRMGSFVTSDFNPTGLSNRNDRELIVTNSGVIDVIDARGQAQTGAGIDIVDPYFLNVKAHIPLGSVAASFHEMALTIDGSRGFLGSAAHGHVYEIDLINRQVLRGADNPHIVSDGADYISDVALSSDNSYFFVSSFEESAVFPFDLSVSPALRGDGFVVGYPAGVTPENPSGANTGAGPLAVRPGIKGVDFTGADLFVITGYPGKLISIDTEEGGTVSYPTRPDEDIEETADDDTPAPEPPDGSEDEPCQGFAQAVHSVDYGDYAGFGQSGFPGVVLGPPRGRGELAGGLHVLSLGRYGEIVLDLGNCPVVDGEGLDFLVFENAFYIGGNPSAPYAELAVVGVSEYGINFVEFECSESAYPYDGCAGWHPVLSNPDNGISPFSPEYAGGDQFNLANVGVERARFIRIRDISGAIGGSSAGFDLDAVAVVNGRTEN